MYAYAYIYAYTYMYTIYVYTYIFIYIYMDILLLYFIYYCYNYKLAALIKKSSIIYLLASFFSIYNERLLLRQILRVGHACICPRSQDGHWLASFEVIPPLPKSSFSAAKKMKISH